MKRASLVVLLAVCCGWVGTVEAVTVTLYSYFNYQDDCTTRLADGNTVLVIASTQNSTFGALTGGSAAPGDSFTAEPDDVVVARLTFDSSTIGTPGAFSSAFSFELGEQGVAGGNPLLLVWYDGLAESGNPAWPGPGVSFGSFRATDWVVPANNSALIDLLMVTPAASAELGDVANATEAQGCASLITSGQANLPPIAQCVGSVSKNADVNCSATVTVNEVNNGSSDPEGDPITFNLDPPGPYGVGSNAVALRVADNQGHTNLCITSVVVVDVIPPAFTCPGDVIGQAALGETNAIVNFPSPTATDNCSVASVTSVPASGASFPLGTNTVAWTVLDGSGNSANCNSLVIVKEISGTNTLPTAICQNITRAASNNCQIVVSAAEVSNGSIDDDGDPITLTLSPTGPFSLGSNAVTLVVADNRGGTNSCQAVVTVIDATAPTIVCSSNIETQVLEGVTSAVVNYPAPVVSDLCSSVTFTSVPPSGASFPLGTNIVTTSAVDGAGNTNTCTFIITVRSAGTGPTMQCQNLVRDADENCSAAVTAAEVDNGSFDPNGGSLTLSLEPAGPFPAGTNAVTLTGVDDLGNSNTCAALIIVQDVSLPELVGCPGDFTVNATAGTTNAVVNFTDPIATNACGSATVTCVPSSGSLLPLGTNEVVCTAVNLGGNTNSCAFNVVVREAGSVARDLAVVKVKGPKRVKLKASQSTVTARIVVTIQNLGPQAETITSLDGLVDLQAESLLSALCPDLTAVLATTQKASLPVTLKPKKKLSISFDVSYAVSCIPDLRQTTKQQNADDYRYVAIVNRAVIDGDPDVQPQNDTLSGPVTDVVVFFF